MVTLPLPHYIFLLSDRFCQRDIERLILALAQAGALVQTSRERSSSEDQYRIVDSEALRNVLTTCRVVTPFLPSLDKDIALVATLPSDLKLPYPMRTLFDSLQGALHRLIVTAQRHAVLVNPFFEESGLDLLQGALLGTLARGVSVEILTRDLHSPSKGSINAALLGRFVSEASEKGQEEKLRIWDVRVRK